MKSIRILLAFLALTVPLFAYADPIDINLADVPTLTKNIKGIGVKKAQAIIAYREEHGLFSKIEELTKIKGIGVKLIERNRDSLFVESKEINLKNQ
jgi:competence protein ComEA